MVNDFPLSIYHFPLFMRAAIQRVSCARVTVDNELIGEINQGILILLGVSNEDTEKEADYILDKTINLRIFDNAEGKMNLSLADIQGGLLIVSQFTLYGDARRGRRPSYIKAAEPAVAANLYQYFIAEARRKIEKVETGQFQAMMNVELINDGPVTILLDSEKLF